jgi:hypothetical protein
MIDIIPSARISATYGLALVNESLKDVAQCLANVERHVIEIVDNSHNKNVPASSSCSPDGPGAVFLSQKDIDDLPNVWKQFADVYNGQPYHKDYLTDKHLLRYWNEAIKIVGSQLSAPVDSVDPNPDLGNALRQIATKAKEMDSSLYSAVRAHALDAGTQTAIGDKWLRMNDLVHLLNVKTGGVWSLKDWYFSFRLYA